MTRGRRNTVPTLSLFPFLAVLLCTMGILVVFLYISVRMAGEQAKLKRQSEVRPDTAAQKERLRSEITLDEIRIDSWSQDRERLVKKLQSARAKQSELIRQTDEIRLELETLAEQKQRFRDEKIVDQARTGQELQNLQAQIQALNQQIQDREQRLAESSAPAETTLYSVIPYEGVGGTGRRPIYVECTSDAVIFQPLGIRLTAADFLETGMSGNPLDAALAEIRDYWVRTDVAGTAGRPYPLMIVRPDGAASYSAARRAMTSWTDEFGYELISDDLQLDTGAVDPELKLAVEKAVERSRLVMAEYHKHMEFRREAARQAQASQQHETVVQGLRASRVGGGFVSAGGPGSRSMSSRNQAGFGQTNFQDSFGKNEISRPEGAPDEFGNNFNNNSAAGSGNSPEGNADSMSSTPTSSQNNVANGTSGKRGTTSGTGDGSSGDRRSNDSATANQSGGNPEGTNNNGSNNPASCPCLADQRGEEWAIQRTESQVTGYRRPILVWCDASQIRVDPGASTWLNLNSIPFSQSHSRTADQLVVEIQRVVKSWGAPPENGYWRPELRIRVMPGGSARAQEVGRLLERSGIETAESRGQ